MGIRIPGMVHAKHILQIRSLSSKERERGAVAADVPRGHFPIYVGEEQKRFVVPISYLKHPLFQELLRRAEEEFGCDHGMGCLTLPCEEDMFLSVTSRILCSCS